MAEKKETQKKQEIEKLVAAVATVSTGGGNGDGVRGNAFGAFQQLYDLLPDGTTIIQGSFARVAKEQNPDAFKKHAELMTQKNPGFDKSDINHRWYMHCRQFLQKMVKDGRAKRVASEKNATYKKIK